MYSHHFLFNEFTFQEKIKQEFGIECYMPANGETATIKTPITIAASVSANLLRDEARRFDTRQSGHFTVISVRLWNFKDGGS